MVLGKLKRLSLYMRRFDVKRVALFLLTIAIVGAGVGVLIGLGQEEAPPQAPEELVALAEKVSVQLDAAFQEAAFGWIAPNFEDVQASGQRLLNIIAGMNSEDYVPIEGGAAEEIGAHDNIASLRSMLVDTAWSDFTFTADSIFTFVGWARDSAKKVLEMTDEEEARTEIHRAEAFLRAALGCNDGLPTTGGAKAILMALRGN